MSKFNKIQDPISTFDEKYVKNNPNILNHIIDKLKTGKPFHYLFTGVVGCGKTYLARNVVVASQEQWEAIKVIDFYKKYLGLLGSSYDDKWQALKNQDSRVKNRLLVLDDLGDEKPSTEAAHDYFSGLIEMRYDYINKNPFTRTIITTNLDSKKLERMYGSRVYDRIQEHFIICKFKPISFRREKHKVLES
jgi:DNA replication protein DnaC